MHSTAFEDGCGRAIMPTWRGVPFLGAKDTNRKVRRLQIWPFLDSLEDKDSLGEKLPFHRTSLSIRLY